MASNWASEKRRRRRDALAERDRPASPPLAVCSSALSCAAACRTTMQRIGRIARARFIMWADLFSSA